MSDRIRVGDFTYSRSGLEFLFTLDEGDNVTTPELRNLLRREAVVEPE